MLQSMGLQGVGRDLATEQQKQEALAKSPSGLSSMVSKDLFFFFFFLADPITSAGSQLSKHHVLTTGPSGNSLQGQFL